MIRYAIIENEDYALENLRSLVEELRPDYQCVFEAGSVEETLAWLRARPQVDLIFMDVELNDGRCFELFSRMEILSPVIFTTAYDAYLKNAFEANSIDYLLKPVFEKDLAKAVDKFERLRLGIRAEELAALERERLLKPAYTRRLRIQVGDRFYFIDTTDIAYFVSEDKYVLAYTSDGRRHLTGVESLKVLADRLDPEVFFMVSRSCIASISAVGAVHKHFGNKLKVDLRAGSQHSSQIVSSARRRDFLSWLGSE